MEDSRAVSDWLGAQELLSGQVRSLDTVLAAIEKTSREDVRQIAGTLFRRDRLNLAVVGPFRSESQFARLLTL
jgi:predicted Zn-dependent peptidase